VTFRTVSRYMRWDGRWCVTLRLPRGVDPAKVVVHGAGREHGHPGAIKYAWPRRGGRLELRGYDCGCKALSHAAADIASRYPGTRVVRCRS
jgi:hypothetical protein